MTINNLAELIPAEYRSEILRLNMIQLASYSPINSEMSYLMSLWKTYIEPDLVVNCPLCYERILNNWRQVQDPLISLEKNASLLKSLPQQK